MTNQFIINVYASLDSVIPMINSKSSSEYSVQSVILKMCPLMPGKAHNYVLYSDSQKFPQCCFWNTSNVSLTDDGPIQSFQGRPFHQQLCQDRHYGTSDEQQAESTSTPESSCQLLRHQLQPWSKAKISIKPSKVINSNNTKSTLTQYISMLTHSQCTIQARNKYVHCPQKTCSNGLPHTHA